MCVTFATCIYWGKESWKQASRKGSDLPFLVSLRMKSSQLMPRVKGMHPRSVRLKPFYQYLPFRARLISSIPIYQCGIQQ